MGQPMEIQKYDDGVIVSGFKIMEEIVFDIISNCEVLMI
jgi:hypothetical protein